MNQTKATNEQDERNFIALYNRHERALYSQLTKYSWKSIFHILENRNWAADETNERGFLFYIRISDEYAKTEHLRKPYFENRSN